MCRLNKIEKTGSERQEFRRDVFDPGLVRGGDVTRVCQGKQLSNRCNHNHKETRGALRNLLIRQFISMFQPLKDTRQLINYLISI